MLSPARGAVRVFAKVVDSELFLAGRERQVEGAQGLPRRSALAQAAGQPWLCR